MTYGIPPLLTLTAAILLSGCATSSHVIVGRTRPPISPELVQIYTTAPENSEEIALLDASSKNSWSFTSQGKMDKAIERLKREAAKLGANGVLLRSTGDQYGGAVSSGSATATAYGNTATAWGSGISTPVFHKAAAGIAIFVPDSSPTRERTVVDDLRMLKQLLEEGIITQEEFESRKQKILDGK